jgi:hypothetical protein
MFRRNTGAVLPKLTEFLCIKWNSKVFGTVFRRYKKLKNEMGDLLEVHSKLNIIVRTRSMEKSTDLVLIHSISSSHS